MEHETKLYSCLFWKGLQLTPPLDYLNLKSLHFWCRHPVAGWHFGCGTRWHNVAGVWVSLQLKRLPRWSSTKPCYQPTPYLRQDVRRHKIPWTCAFPSLLAGDMRYSSRAESELLNLHTYGTQDMYLEQKSMVQLPSWYLPPTHQGCFWICNLHGHIKTTMTIQRHCLINLPGDLCYANDNEKHREFTCQNSITVWHKRKQSNAL